MKKLKNLILNLFSKCSWVSCLFLTLVEFYNLYVSKFKKIRFISWASKKNSKSRAKKLKTIIVLEVPVWVTYKHNKESEEEVYMTND